MDCAFLCTWTAGDGIALTATGLAAQPQVPGARASQVQGWHSQCMNLHLSQCMDLHIEHANMVLHSTDLQMDGMKLL